LWPRPDRSLGAGAGKNGILSLLIQDIFTRLHEGESFQVWLHAVELFQEQCRDLLSPRQSGLKVMDGAHTHTGSCSYSISSSSSW
jgi:hypothetical protein